MTIPAEIRNRLGLKEGDVVAFTETDDGVLISPQAVIAAQALDRIGDTRVFLDTSVLFAATLFSTSLT